MNSKALVVTPLLAVLGVWGLLAFDPIGHVRDWMRVSSVDRDVTNLYMDAMTQETSRSDHPLASLRTIEPAWCSATEKTRFMLVGNSQTMAVVLAPGEPVMPAAEKTYPDYLFDRFRDSHASVRGYRLSAPNIGYVEALWYLTYLLSHRCLIPTDLVLQLNFDTLRKTGIRDGMLELLDDPAFAAMAAVEARADRPYGTEFAQAIARYHTRLTSRTGARSENAAVATATGLTVTQGPGARIETRVRALLNKSAAFKTRTTVKNDLLNLLYLARARGLGITTTTKRSISAATLALNVSALERIGELCRAQNVHLILFNAPQNPRVPLYNTDGERDAYHREIAAIESRYAWHSYDFENAIGEDLWGVWVDGPDPIHFGRAAHRQFAQLLLDNHVIPTDR